MDGDSARRPEKTADESRRVVLTPVVVTKKKGLSIRLLMFMIGGVAILLAMWSIMGEALIPAAIFLSLLFGAVFVIWTFRIGSGRQETLLLSLAIASERSMPLSPAAMAFAEQYGKGFRNRVQRFAMLLDEGVPLPRATEMIRGLFGSDARLLAASGWFSGMLGPALRQAAEMRRSRQVMWGPFEVRIGYLASLFLAMEMIFTFLMYATVPHFESIFMNFGIPLPPVTLTVIAFSHFMMDYYLLFIAIVFVQVMILGILPASLLNIVETDVPLLDSMFRRKHVGLVLRSLSFSVDGGKPIEEGLQLLLQSYPSTWIRSRLAIVRDLIRRGEPWNQSLERVGLLSSNESESLETSMRVGNLGWMLRELAEASDRRIGYQLQFWSQLFYPVIIFVIGLMILVICVAYFSPLVTLISRLA